jgi:hypothetical protein
LERTPVRFTARPHQVIDAQYRQAGHAFEQMPRQTTSDKPANAGDGDLHETAL